MELSLVSFSIKLDFKYYYVKYRVSLSQKLSLI